MQALIDGEHIFVSSEQNQHSKPLRLYMSSDDIAAFHRNFVTASTLVKALKLDRKTILARLRRASVKPYRPNGQDFGNLYLRKKVAAAFDI